MVSELYLVVDVEATCDERDRVPRNQREIIEIGAVLLDAAFTVVDEFQRFVRPVRHPRLTEFCTRLTSITQADVDRAPRFPAAIAALVEWLGERFSRTVFCSWGDYDRKQLLQDCQYHGIDYPMPARHLNLKELFAKARGLQRRLGMAKALEQAGLPLQGAHHRGIDDARNIARLLPLVFGTRDAG